MGAPKEKPIEFHGTAVKLAIHQAAGEKVPGVYRYVIVGLLVTDKPLDPMIGTSSADFGDRNKVAESVDFAADQFRDAIAFLPKRESKIQGMSADQNLTRLREL